MAVTRSGMGLPLSVNLPSRIGRAEIGTVSSALAQSSLRNFSTRVVRRRPAGGSVGDGAHRASSACSMRRRSICVRCARRSMPSAGSVATSVFVRTHAGTRQRACWPVDSGISSSAPGLSSSASLRRTEIQAIPAHASAVRPQKSLPVGDAVQSDRAVLGRQVTNVAIRPAQMIESRSIRLPSSRHCRSIDTARVRPTTGRNCTWPRPRPCYGR